ncbi:MAG: tetratricopeptide (TPR) repeat protein [Flavobacteriaceae bacterium]|jgi:tetratricopeptide (TPR) repeat protein
MILFFRHKIYLVAVIALLSMGDKSFAQSTYSDFISEDSMELKVEHALNLWNYYTRNCTDSLKVLSVDVAKITHLSKTGVAASQLCLGSYYVRGGELEVGINYLKNARAILAVEANMNLLSDVDNTLANAFNLLGNYRVAAKYYMLSLITGHRSPESTSSFNGLIGLGKVFCSVGDTLLGVRLISIYLAKSIYSNKFESASNACAYLAVIVDQNEDSELAMAYLRRSLVYSRETNSVSHKASAVNNRAILYFSEGKMDSSLVFFERALELRMKFGQKKSIIESYFNLGEYYLKIEDYNRSEEFLNKSLILAEENGFLPDHLDALVLLEQLYLLSNDIDESLKGVQLELKRVRGLINQNSEIDKSIYSIAMTFEEPVKELFETKPKTLLNMKTVGAICLILLCLIFLKINKRLI